PWLRHPGPLTNWRVSNGEPLRAGQTIETGASDGLKIESAVTGEVRLEPDSRLRLVAATEHEQRFDLQRGTIHAFIWAPPGRFVVDTPSAKTIDLGCRYTLHVSKNGTGLLTVETGWVAFEWRTRESFIPAGAACITRPGRGPGTPWYSDAPAALRGAVERFDATGDARALGEAVSASRERDALTLWHLLVRTRGEQRGQVFDRLSALVRLPRQVTREAILAGDSGAIDGAWDALNLGNTDWWRRWKGRW
ncbi:MAG TPA: FecR domain-containing protein, partial [Bryobacteraceae bacterium]|nr:FecR domain-containing protein [Bryobacteraceae bacterium]